MVCSMLRKKVQKTINLIRYFEMRCSSLLKILQIFHFSSKQNLYTTLRHVKMLRDVVILSIGINGKVTLNRSSELSQTKSNSVARCKATVKRLQS